MKRTVVMAVMAILMLACGIGYATAVTPSPAPPTAVSHVPTQTMRVGIISLTPTRTTIITAPEGLRLRDRPDASGPVDSVELSIMPQGEIFTVESCQQVRGEWWAFGYWHVNRPGWAKAEYLSPNPCE